MTTHAHAPGAASELLPCPFCGKTPKLQEISFGGHPFFIVRCCYVDIGRKWPREQAVTAWNKRQMNSAGDISIAPVTEGAQREAVAYRWRFTDHKKWHAVAGDPPQSFLNDSYYTVELLYPPPPDRVQPERVEADWESCGKCGRWRCDVLPSAPPTDGNDSCKEGCAISGIEHAECIVAETPTDASGGVTDAMVEAAHTTYYAPYKGSQYEAIIGDRNAMRRALEAADRARNPDHSDIGSVYEQAEAWETIVKMLDEIAPGWNHIEGQGTGTNLACHAIRKLLSARKPGYRQVTLDDAVAFLRHYIVEHRRKSDNESVLAALKAIGAVIPEASLEQGEKG